VKFVDLIGHIWASEKIFEQILFASHKLFSSFTTMYSMPNNKDKNPNLQGDKHKGFVLQKKHRRSNR